MIEVPSADELRAMGIDDPTTVDDDDLIESVRLLLGLGVSLDDLVGADLTETSARINLRPGPYRPLKVIPEATGLDPATAIRFSLALGFPVNDLDDDMSEDEIEALRYFAGLRELVGEESLIGLLRVIGTSLDRISRAVTMLLRVNVERPLFDATGRRSDVIATYSELIDSALPGFLTSTTTLMRSHMAAQVTDTWGVDPTETTTIEELVVGFADLVGFTSLAETSSAHELITKIGEFETRVNNIVVAFGATLVKLIGDEVMFVAPTAEQALAVARRLARLDRDGRMLPMRVGLHAGEVISSLGDYYGPVVNAAARIVHEAEPDTIVVTPEVLALLDEEIATEPLGQVSVRGFTEAFELHQIRP